MPRWLEPIVPHLQLEGSTTPAAPAAPEPAAPEAVGPAKTKTAEDKEAEAATATGARRRPSAR
jgi:hypothetical protein